MQFEPGTLEAFGLFLVRSSALVLSAPVLGSTTGFSGYKIALIMSVSFLLYSVHGEPLGHVLLPIEFGCLAMREILIGLALAFSLHAVMLALRVAGELVGHEMGFNMAAIIDPVSGLRTPIITQIYEAFFILGFLMVDGHQLLLRGLAQSFERAPVGTLDMGEDIPWLIERLFSQMFTAGFTFAAPVLIVLVSASLLLAFLARAVPQLNVNEAGFTARIAVGMLSLFVFAPLLTPGLHGLYAHFEKGMAAVLDAIAI
ncbi:MAG: flagellar biosynthetic protein FliR [Planctomycetes bacterium]|nr:flagellar biosynthetic protein FliR [Planctomycetota bacterium]